MKNRIAYYNERENERVRKRLRQRVETYILLTAFYGNGECIAAAVCEFPLAGALCAIRCKSHAKPKHSKAPTKYEPIQAQKSAHIELNCVVRGAIAYNTHALNAL